jgi:hypothetical protein
MMRREWQMGRQESGQASKQLGRPRSQRLHGAESNNSGIDTANTQEAVPLPGPHACRRATSGLAAKAAWSPAFTRPEAG